MENVENPASYYMLQILIREHELSFYNYTFYRLMPE